MTKLLVVFAVALILAYLSEQNTEAATAAGHHYSVWGDWAYIALVVVLSLFAGLRTSYNDTWNYVEGFQNAPELGAWLSDPENLNPFKNPLFYFYNSFLHSCGVDAQILIFTTSVLTQAGFLLCFKRYSHSFTFSVFLYFTLGTFNVSLAAMKQVCAMAICTFAFPALEKKQWVRYYLIIAIAMMVHTYAMAFAVLPLFMNWPWSWFTYVFVGATVILMLNFEGTITAFIEQAEELGKSMSEEEIFDDHAVNFLRVAVYLVGPLISFLFAKWIFVESKTMDHVLVHMSIISCAFIMMGTQGGANMFARMAHYFELGTICCLPWMLRQTFDERSYRMMRVVAVVCFLAFFVVANAGFFDYEYRSLIW